MPSSTYHTLFVLFLGVGLAMRLTGLGSQSLWSDEGVTLANALQPLDRLPEELRRDVHPPLYYALMHAWVWGGMSEYWLRLPSVLANLGMVAVGGKLLERMLGRPVALLSVAWLSLSAFQCLYAQEARSHALTGLTFTASTFFLWRWLQDGRRTGAVSAGWLIAAVACMHTSYFGWVVLPVHTAIVLAASPARRLWTSWALHVLAAAACVMPWALYVASGLSTLAISQGYATTSGVGLGQVTAMLWDLAFSHDYPNPYLSLTAFGPLTAAGLGALAALCVLGFARFARGGTRIGAISCGLWVAVPVGLTVLLSYVGLDVFVNKYFLLVTPALAALFSMGLMTLWRWKSGRALAVAVVVGWLWVNLVSWSEYSFDPRFGNQNWRAVAELLNRDSRPDDLIVLQPAMMIFAFSYYYGGTAPVLAVNTRDEAAPRLATRPPRVWLVTVPAYEVVTTSSVVGLLGPPMAPVTQLQTENFHPAQMLRVQLFEVPR